MPVLYLKRLIRIIVSVIRLLNNKNNKFRPNNSSSSYRLIG